MSLSCYIQIACLPDPAKVFYPTEKNIDAWTAGWGKIQGLMPDNLQNIKITLLDGFYCRLVQTSLVKDWSIQICAGVKI